LNISANSNLNFKGLTSSSNSYIQEKARELKQQGQYFQAADLLRAGKRLSAKAKGYNVIVSDGVIILNPQRVNAKSIEIVDGFFKTTPLAEFLKKAANRVELEKLKLVRYAKIRKMMPKCLLKLMKKISRA